MQGYVPRRKTGRRIGGGEPSLRQGAEGRGVPFPKGSEGADHEPLWVRARTQRIMRLPCNHPHLHLLPVLCLSFLLCKTDRNTLLSSSMRAESSLKVSSTSPYNPETSLLGKHPKELQVWSRMFRAVKPIIKRWNELTCPSTHERINQVWSIHTLASHSALKRKGILTQALTWMNPEDIMLSERSWSQKDKSCRVPLIQGP